MVFSKFRNQKGFTLIELMIVVAIIGILAAIAIPNVITYLKKSKTAEAKQFLSTLRTLQEAYKSETDLYGTLDSIGWTTPANFKYYATYGVTYTTGASFTARVSGNVDSDATTDAWTINDGGTLSHAAMD